VFGAKGLELGLGEITRRRDLCLAKSEVQLSKLSNQICLLHFAFFGDLAHPRAHTGGSV